MYVIYEKPLMVIFRYCIRIDIGFGENVLFMDTWIILGDLRRHMSEFGGSFTKHTQLTINYTFRTLFTSESILSTLN